MTKAEKTHLTHAHVTDLLKGMIRIRHFEDKCAELYTQQKIRGFLHLYDGEEAIAIGVISVLGKNDRIVATYREHGHALARGVPMPEVMAEMYGKAEGCSGGRGGSMHLFHAPSNFFGGNAIVGGGLPLAGGLALGDKLSGADGVTVCFFGEGAVAEGEFHETMNLAELWDVPALFVCENNGYAMGSALGRTESETDIHAKAAAYGIASEVVDGQDVVAVEAAAPPCHRQHSRDRQTLFPRMPHLSLSRPFDVRRAALPRQGGDREVPRQGADRPLPGMAAREPSAAGQRHRPHRGRSRCRDH
jgi:2-oxoisovalerate dehydrogenase E1 component